MSCSICLSHVTASKSANQWRNSASSDGGSASTAFSIDFTFPISMLRSLMPLAHKPDHPDTAPSDYPTCIQVVVTPRGLASAQTPSPPPRSAQIQPHRAGKAPQFEERKSTRLNSSH